MVNVAGRLATVCGAQHVRHRVAMTNLQGTRFLACFYAQSEIATLTSTPTHLADVISRAVLVQVSDELYRPGQSQEAAAGYSLAPAMGWCR